MIRQKIKKTGLGKAAANKGQLGLITRRGKLRVGYNPENLPFSFVNDKGDLVGFDVELMHVLANELNVELEFIPWTYKTILKELEKKRFDVAIGGLIVTPERLANAAFAMPLGSSDLGDFNNNWLQMKKISGLINTLYAKRVLGKSDEKEKQRRSIGRDVFGLWK